MNTTKSIKEQDSLIVRLERNHQCVLRQIQNMNSYRFEPKDYECFVRLHDLKINFKQLEQDQVLLFDKLHHNTHKVTKATELVEEILERFKKIESELASYLLDTRG